MTAVYNKTHWRASVSNGRISRRLLAEIVPKQYDPDLRGPAVMHPEAAAAMSALLAKAREDGITELKVKYSYRTYDKQVEKWLDYQNHNGNLAAVPGTSNHGWAVSVDFTGLTTRALSWLRRNARRFGFVADVTGENWHYTYQGGWSNPKEVDEVNFEHYVDGESLYRKRYKNKGRDPGPPPKGRNKWFSKGWNSARFAANNPGK